MLTRINGSYDIQSILKITPMPQLDALLVFWKLKKSGYIKLAAGKGRSRAVRPTAAAAKRAGSPAPRTATATPPPRPRSRRRPAAPPRSPLLPPARRG